jgi:hypothetical protein
MTQTKGAAPAPDEEFSIIRSADCLEDVIEGIGDDAPKLRRIIEPLHRVRLPAPRLPVRKDGTVEALNHAFHQRVTALLHST